MTLRICQILFLLLCTAVTTRAADRPSIIIFLADDLGYADIGVNGCQDIPTPNIDSIANNGVRFTDGYATHCVCSPSRAGLMSGMYQHRFGFEANSGPERYADPNFGLPRSVPTLAEKLHAAGYATGMIGKWHIGYREGLRPHERGFDYHYGFLSGAHSYNPGQRDNSTIVRNGEPVKPTRYLTDEFAEEAAGFLDRSRNQPFFLYLAFNAVHSPMDANPCEQRFEGLSGKRRTFAGMLTALDLAVGRVLDTVRKQGREENTLVFFYSDNGGPTADNSSRNTPLRGFKTQFYEGGIRVPFLMQWKAQIPAGQTYGEMVAGFDCHVTALAAAGIAVPLNQPLDGADLVPFVTGQASGRPHDHLFWRAGQQHAARVGDWKLVQERGGSDQLFNLADDIGETEDLANSEPAKLQELQAAYAAWDSRMLPAQWVRQDASNAQPGGKLRAKGKGPGGPGAANRIAAAFEAADKDGDGRLTRAEYPQQELFDAVDADDDGFATVAEVRAFYQQRRSAPETTPKSP
ncbi:MAG: sulfatase-like hydrolase/transferase [Planctomycetota bacterium]